VAKTIKTRLSEIGVTQENAVIAGTCAAGLALFSVGMTILDEGAKFASPSEADYKAFTRTLYGSPAGQLAGTVGMLYGIALTQDFMIDQKQLSKNAKRKARAASMAFASASLLSRLDAFQIGQRFEYLSSGSLPAALNPTGPDAALLNQARTN
jgi:hypothetical protein